MPAVVFGAGAWWALDRYGPVVEGTAIKPVPAFAAILLVICASVALADLFRLLGSLLEWIAARTPRGHKGTARWIRRLREFGKDIKPRGWGPYWGSFKGREVIADYSSNACTLGPSGLGKGVAVAQPNILAIRHSKTIIDFKGELACVLARTLRERGEEVYIFNIGDMWPDILGPSAEYNFLHVIADNFQRPGGIQDVTDDVDEICLQLLPEAEGAKDDNIYFRQGSRTFVGFAIQTCILIHGPEATLGHAAQMLNDRQSLLQHALWACGRLARREDGA